MQAAEYLAGRSSNARQGRHVRLKDKKLNDLVSCGLAFHHAGLVHEDRSIIEKLFIEDSFRLIADDDFGRHFRTMPMSGFGLFQDFHYQLRELKVLEGDALILLTDGVYSHLKEEELSYLFFNAKEENNRKISKIFKLYFL